MVSLKGFSLSFAALIIFFIGAHIWNNQLARLELENGEFKEPVVDVEEIHDAKTTVAIDRKKVNRDNFTVTVGSPVRTSHAKAHEIKSILSGNSKTSIKIDESDGATDASVKSKLKNKGTLLSMNCMVASDVRGNLGPPGVVTNTSNSNWYEDRWQSAKDMSGTPIPGPHWLVIDIGSHKTSNDQEHIGCITNGEGPILPPTSISKIVLNWEDAYSSKYLLEGCDIDSQVGPSTELGNMCVKHCNTPSSWQKISTHSRFKTKKRFKHHIVQEYVLPPPDADSPVRTDASSFRCVRLKIDKDGTRFGSSLWEIQIWGDRT